MHLIVQRERVIALAPVVTDARFTVDDQGVDAQLREPRGDREPGLTAADHQNGRVAIFIRGGRFAQIEPVGTAKIARVGLALRPRLADMLLVSLDLVERREQRPGLGAAIRGIGHEPQHPTAAPLRLLEAEDRFDRG